MNKPLTYLLSLTFLFLYPSISFSQTFKCEFVREKFDGGKKNIGKCSGDPEIIFGSGRTQHCKDSGVPVWSEYKNYVVDLDKKLITFIEITGLIRDDRYEKSDEGKVFHEILDVRSFTETLVRVKKKVVEKTLSYLITYTDDYSSRKQLSTLYIPQNGKSIISTYYRTMDDRYDGSWIEMKFGKCVNPSN